MCKAGFRRCQLKFVLSCLIKKYYVIVFLSELKMITCDFVVVFLDTCHRY